MYEYKKIVFHYPVPFCPFPLSPYCSSSSYPSYLLSSDEGIGRAFLTHRDMALQNPLTTNSTTRLSDFNDRKMEKTALKASSGSLVGGMKASSLLPVLPPLAPRRHASYPLAVQAAPFTALRAMLVYDDEPEPHQVTPRCRLRTQVRSLRCRSGFSSFRWILAS